MELPSYVPESLKNEIGEYTLEPWLSVTGVEPIELITQVGYGGYEVNIWYVFKNRNGSFALINEKHCSCYGSQAEDVEGIYCSLSAVEKHIRSLMESDNTNWENERFLALLENIRVYRTTGEKRTKLEDY